jgi:peptidoglycan/LPS O-acetylase OafA/YrhL
MLAAATGTQTTRLQDFFGRASYHLFISHMPVAAVLAVGLHFDRTGPLLLITAVAVSLCLSTLLVPIERWINVLRQQIAP